MRDNNTDTATVTENSTNTSKGKVVGEKKKSYLSLYTDKLSSSTISKRYSQ